MKKRMMFFYFVLLAGCSVGEVEPTTQKKVCYQWVNYTEEPRVFHGENGKFTKLEIVRFEPNYEGKEAHLAQQKMVYEDTYYLKYSYQLEGDKYKITVIMDYGVMEDEDLLELNGQYLLDIDKEFNESVEKTAYKSNYHCEKES